MVSIIFFARKYFASAEKLTDGKKRTIKNNFIIVPALMELAGFEKYRNILRIDILQVLVGLFSRNRRKINL